MRYTGLTSPKIGGGFGSSHSGYGDSRADDWREQLVRFLDQLCSEIDAEESLDSKLFRILKMKQRLASFGVKWRIDANPTGFGGVRIEVKLICDGDEYDVCEFVVESDEDEQKAVEQLTADDAAAEELVKSDSQGGMFF